MRRRLLLIMTFGLAGLVLSRGKAKAQRSLSVRVDRWLAIREISGSVSLSQSGTTRSAAVGDRLQSVGEGLTTGSGASATLEVDTGIGFVDVSENTRLQVQELAVAPDNGRITRLQVSQGQARLRVRRFTHSGSALEIQTPAGISGVRGTEFGVNVQPDGKMGVATLSGSVATRAQGTTVLVDGGYQNLTIPGEPPLPAVPLTDNTELTYRIVRIIDAGQRRARLIGQVDPVNSVIIDGVSQTTSRDGQFTVELPLQYRVRTEVTVITPLGRQQVHQINTDL